MNAPRVRLLTFNRVISRFLLDFSLTIQSSL
jgi:hypothetical protein